MDRLKSIVERVEQVNSEKAILAEDIRGIFAEAKSNGFDVKALRYVVKLRAQDKAKRQEHEAVVQTYCNALGIEW